MGKYCAISIMCRDENQYLKEWIDYHLLIGFDHIQIWDNESKIPISLTVCEYISKKVVSVKNIKGLRDIHRQCSTQTQAMKDLKEYKWVALLDTDEFIVLLDKEVNIKQYLKKYEAYGAVALNWLMFGSNGHEKTQKSQLESFTQSCPSHSANKHIKSIVQPSKFLSTNNMHYVQSIHPTVNVNNKKVKGSFNNPPIIDKIMRINHYVTRSKEDYELKKLRGPGDNNNEQKTKKYSEAFFKSYNSENVQNTDILKLVERIKSEKNSTSNNNI